MLTNRGEETGTPLKLGPFGFLYIPLRKGRRGRVVRHERKGKGWRGCSGGKLGGRRQPRGAMYNAHGGRGGQGERRLHLSPSCVFVRLSTCGSAMRVAILRGPWRCARAFSQTRARSSAHRNCDPRAFRDGQGVREPLCTSQHTQLILTFPIPPMSAWQRIFPGRGA